MKIPAKLFLFLLFFLAVTPLLRADTIRLTSERLTIENGDLYWAMSGNGALISGMVLGAVPGNFQSYLDETSSDPLYKMFSDFAAGYNGILENFYPALGTPQVNLLGPGFDLYQNLQHGVDYFISMNEVFLFNTLDSAGGAGAAVGVDAGASDTFSESDAASVTVTHVPEPSTLLLLVAGWIAAGVLFLIWPTTSS